MNPGNDKKPTILVVDDSQAAVATIQDVLGKDYSVLTAFDGMAAIDLYKKKNPDLVLLDIEMPGIDGFEVCRLIKTLSGTDFVPVIFISDKTDLASMKTALQSGAQDYLTKPFEPEELVERIRSALRTRKLYGRLLDAYATIDMERDIIAKIQQGMLCDHPPEIPGFKFFSEYQPSSKAGGDYYDFIVIDEEHLGVMVSDVSGHGCPAAVIMAMMRVLLRSVFAEVRSPNETLEKINAILCDNIESGHFITAFYGIIHLPTRRMKYSSAGHNPPILIEYDTKKIHHLKTDKGFPLVILPQNTMDEKEIELPPNSKLILYTDGLTESKNSRGEMFGLDRLSQNLLELGREMDAAQLGTRITQMVQEFIHETAFTQEESLLDLTQLVRGYVHDTKFTDDYTLVILEVEPDSG